MAWKRVAFACAFSVTSLASGRSEDGGPEPKASPSPSAAPREFTVVAIGDTGERNLTLYRNARGVNGELADKKKDNAALVFLGDNFYEHGLSDSSPDERERRFKSIYGLFERSFAKLGHELGRWKDDECANPPRGCEAATGSVHAVAGNHDYYSESKSKNTFRIGALVPLGFSTSGNEYESTRKEWNYYYGEPREAYWPLERQDRKGVQAIFVDSAVIVRGAPAPQYTGVWFYGFFLPPYLLSGARGQLAEGLCWNSLGFAQDCLSYAFRRRIKDRLTELLRERARDNVWRVLFAHHPLHTLGAHGGARWRPDPSGGEGEVRIEDLCSEIHNPLGWATNRFDPQDQCADGWTEYRQLVLEAIRDAKADVHAFVAGHDHSLQHLRREAVTHPGLGGRWYPRRHIVSGAGAKVSDVIASRGDEVRTAQAPNGKGRSHPGWARLKFTPEEMEVTFFSGSEQIKGDINDDAIRFLPPRSGR